MQIETLKIFCDLAELLSFSRTAEKHMLSQSAISQQLAQLELVHKCQLLNRKKRPIELTREGHVLYTAAKEITDRHQKLFSELTALRSEAKNRINVAAIYSIGMHALPEFIKKFMIRSPKVNVHVEYFSADKIYEQIIAGESDVGLVAVPKRDRRIETIDFQQETLVLACSPRHPFADTDHIELSKLQFERVICFEKNVPTREFIDDIFQAQGIVIRAAMEFDNIETIKRAVEINSGVSILPMNTISQELKSGSIKAVEFHNHRMVRPTAIIVRKDRVLSSAAKYFIKTLTNDLREDL